MSSTQKAVMTLMAFTQATKGLQVVEQGSYDNTIQSLCNKYYDDAVLQAIADHACDRQQTSTNSEHRQEELPQESDELDSDSDSRLELGQTRQGRVDLAQTTIPPNIGQIIPRREQGWFYLRGGVAFDQTISETKAKKRNFKLNQAVAWAAAREYPLIIEDQEVGQYHFIKPDPAWRPEYAMLPTGLEIKNWQRYNLIYNQEMLDQIDQQEIDHDVTFPNQQIGKYYSDRDGFARILGHRSFALAEPTAWLPIESAYHLRQLKIESCEQSKSGLVVNTKGEYAFVDLVFSAFTPLNTAPDSEIAFILFQEAPFTTSGQTFQPRFRSWFPTHDGGSMFHMGETRPKNIFTAADPEFWEVLSTGEFRDNYCYEFEQIHNTGKFRDNSPKYWWHEQNGLYELREELADFFQGDARKTTAILQKADGTLIKYWCGETAILEFEADFEVYQLLYSHGAQGGLNSSPYFRSEDEIESSPSEPHFICFDQDSEKDNMFVRNYKFKHEVLEEKGCQRTVKQWNDLQDWWALDYPDFISAQTMAHENQYYTLFNWGDLWMYDCNWNYDLVFKPEDFEWDETVARTGLYIGNSQQTTLWEKTYLTYCETSWDLVPDLSDELNRKGWAQLSFSSLPSFYTDADYTDFTQVTNHDLGELANDMAQLVAIADANGFNNVKVLDDGSILGIKTATRYHPDELVPTRGLRYHLTKRPTLQQAETITEGPFYWGPSKYTSLQVPGFAFMEQSQTHGTETNAGLELLHFAANSASVLGIYSPAGETDPDKLPKQYGRSSVKMKKPGVFNFFSYMLMVRGDEMSDGETIVWKSANYLYTIADIAFGLASFDPMVIFDITGLALSLATEIFGLPVDDPFQTKHLPRNTSFKFQDDLGRLHIFRPNHAGTSQGDQVEVIQFPLKHDGLWSTIQLQDLYGNPISGATINFDPQCNFGRMRVASRKNFQTAHNGACERPEDWDRAVEVKTECLMYEDISIHTAKQDYIDMKEEGATLAGLAELPENTRHPPTADQIGEDGVWATKWRAYNDVLKICVGPTDQRLSPECKMHCGIKSNPEDERHCWKMNEYHCGAYPEPYFSQVKCRSEYFSDELHTYQFDWNGVKDHYVETLNHELTDELVDPDVWKNQHLFATSQIIGYEDADYYEDDLTGNTEAFPLNEDWNSGINTCINCWCEYAPGCGPRKQCRTRRWNHSHCAQKWWPRACSSTTNSWIANNHPINYI